MNLTEPTAYPTGELAELQLRVARRADEIAQTRLRISSINLHCWLLAEAEILGGRVPEPSASMANVTTIREREFAGRALPSG